jgi:acyl-ACP thioesterase
MQEAALKHAGMLGFGLSDMVKNNMLWVLTRMVLNINRELSWDETVCIKTWSRGIEGPYSFREFELYDSKGIKIGSASSSWVPIDFKTRKPTKIFDDGPINKLAIKETVGIEVEKVFIPKEIELGFIHQVHNTDLDINNHANNARYVEWIYNSMPLGSIKAKNGFTFHINYLGEAKLSEQIEIMRSKINFDQKEFYFDGINQQTKKSFFTAKLIIH